MPSIAGILSSIGPARPGKSLAPSDSARSYARRASLTRKAMAQALGTVDRGKLFRWALRLGIEDQVDVTLAKVPDILGAMAPHDLKSQLFEDSAQGNRIGAREFDEFKAVGAHRIVDLGSVRHCEPPVL